MKTVSRVCVACVCALLAFLLVHNLCPTDPIVGLERAGNFPDLPETVRVATVSRQLARFLEGSELIGTSAIWSEDGLVERELYRVPKHKNPLILVERTLEPQADGSEKVEREFAMVADHMIVRLRPGQTVKELGRLNKQYGGKVRKKMLAPDSYLVAFEAPDPDALTNYLAAYNAEAAKIAYAEPDYIVYALATPNDPDFDELWGMNSSSDVDIDAPEAWDVLTDASSVLIGVIDTGVDYTHDDLRANIWTNPGEVAGNGVDDDGNGFIDDVHGWDFYNDDFDPMDDHSHGTHCSGTIGGVGNNNIGVAGVCWNARIMGLKFLSGSGSGNSSDAVDGIYYASAAGVVVTSNSWGGGGYSQSLVDAIEDAGSNDILFVAAAGNSGNDSDEAPLYPGAYDNDNIICVAATDSDDELASFSNYGLTTVDIGAPGVGIYSTVLGNDYDSFNGTSMATPHVAGSVALFRSLAGNLDAMTVKDRVLEVGDSISALQGRTVSGKRLNLNNLVRLSEGPFVRYNGATIDDSAGSDDGLINPGESINLAVVLRNMGLSDANGVSATLESSDSYVSVGTDVTVFGDLAGPGGTATGLAPYTFTISPSCPTPHELNFNLAISDSDGGRWDSEFTLMVYTSTTITGTVTLDGEPLEGAELIYADALQGSVLTEADGTYRIGVIDSAYEVTAQYPGATPTATQLVTVPPEATDIDFAFTTISISGTTHDLLAGGPATDVNVTYSGPFDGEVLSGADGSYTITHILGQPGTFTLVAKKEGVYLDSDPVDVEVPPSKTDIDFNMGAPDVTVTPTTFDVEVFEGETATRSVELQNAGGMNLNWAMGSKQYVSIDSNQPGGPSYDWIEISATGTEIPGIGGFEMVGPLDIGFDFPFYGQSFSEFYVSEHGYITFYPFISRWNNYPLPDYGAPGWCIAFLWDLLTFADENSKAYYQQVDADTFVLQFQDVKFGFELAPLTCELILKRNGHIIVQIQEAGIKDECTVGVQGTRGTDGYTVCYNEPYLEDNMAILIKPNALWLTLPEAVGSVPALDSGLVELQFDSNMTTVGVHTVDMFCGSNDPNKPFVDIDVTFRVKTTAEVPEIDLFRGTTVIENGGTDSPPPIRLNTTDQVTYTIKNTGNASLTLGEFFLTTPERCNAEIITEPAGSIAAGGSSDLVLSISPTERGLWSFSLSATNDDSNESPYTITVEGRATYPEIDIDYGSDDIDIGSTHTIPGSTSGTALEITYVVTSFGAIALELEDFTVADFNNCVASVTTQPKSPMGQYESSDLIVSVAPQSIGDWHFGISGENNDDDENPYYWTIAGTAVAPSADIAISGNSLEIVDGDDSPSLDDHTDFGSTTHPDGSLSREFTISNNGVAELSLSNVDVAGANADDFTITTSPDTTIGGGESTPLGITFVPAALGTRSAVVTISSNDVDESPFTFAIQGAGLNQNPSIDSPADATPNPVTLPETVALTVTASDPNGDPLTYTWSATAGPAAVDFTPNNAADANNSEATFTTAGSYDLQVVVSDGNGGTATSEVTVVVLDSSSDSLVLSIPAIATEGDGTVAGTVHTSRVLGTGEDLVVTLASSDETEVQLTPASVTIAAGASSASFDLLIQDDAEVDSVQTVTITASATDWTSGSAEIDIQDNDGEPEIEIRGNTVPIVSGDDTPTDADNTAYGSVKTGNSAVRSYSIHNLGSNPLQLTGSPLVAVTGAHASDFSVTVVPDDSIAPAASTTFEVTFTPGVLGPRSASVSVASDDADENPYTFAIEGTGTDNAAPTCTITAPTGDISYTAPADIIIEVDAADSDGSIAKVAFFNGATLLGADSTAPYAFDWTGAPVGVHTLTAKATDNLGASTTSAPVTITVNLPGGGGGGSDDDDGCSATAGQGGSSVMLLLFVLLAVTARRLTLRHQVK